MGYAAGGSYARVAETADRAGLALLALVILAGGVVTMARWAVANRRRLQGFAAAALQRPRVAALRRRYHRQLDFVARRLKPGGAFGLSLTLGLAALALLGAAFGEIVDNVLEREEIAAADSPVAAWLAAHRTPWLTVALRAATQLGGLRVTLPLLVGAGAVSWLRTRRLWPSAVLAGSSLGAVALVWLIKLAVARPRPAIGPAIATYGGYAFPSGHSAQAVAAYGAVAYLGARAAKSWAARVWWWAAAVLIALVVGFSRMYLGVHWLTDVLGGYALAGAWLATVVTATTTYVRHATSCRGSLR